MLAPSQSSSQVCAEPVSPQPLGWTFAAHALALAFCLCLWSLPSQAARLALLIGNDSYRSVGPLVNARNDARLMAQTLQRAGFDTTLVNDLDRTRFWAAIDSFKGRVQKGDEIVFYFAGHGVQIGSNQLLLPVDITRQNERQVERDGVSLVEVQDALKDARFAMFVIDACRDNPFPKIGGRSVGGERGLLPPEPATGQIIVMAAGRNQAALDRVPGNAANNGLFTYELAQALQQPGADVRAVLETVKERVDDKAKLVGHEQRPSFVNDLRGNFYFFGATSDRANQPPVVVAQASNTSDDRFFWESVKDTKDANELKAYLNKFPGGLFAELAGIRLRGLEQAAAERIAAEAAQRAALERAASEAAAKEQQRLAMEAQAKEQARLALLAQEHARVASEAAQKLAAARLAALPQPGQTIKDCADCPEMVVIPAGSFEMGSNENADEQPVHRVNVPSFLIGKTEVTQGQWKAVMGSNPSSFGICGDDCPVEKVSWNEAQEFAQRLSQRTGKQYRLPSEAEWEYAARAGSSTKWSFRDSEYPGDYAWFSANNQGKTQRVAQKRPNAFGLFDMHGNVWEWVQDCWHDNYSGAPTDGSAWTTGCSSSSRVLRGGSWGYDPAGLRSAIRSRNAPDLRGSVNGLRLARTLFTP